MKKPQPGSSRLRSSSGEALPPFSLPGEDHVDEATDIFAMFKTALRQITNN